MTEFYAQPYSLDHTGFYFDSIENYESGMRALNKRGCEEVEIQFIDGDDHLASLAKLRTSIRAISTPGSKSWTISMKISYGRSCFLLDLGYNLDEVLDRYEDVCVFEGKASDYAYDLINETTEIPESLRYYIDYDAIARDMQINGEIAEIERELIVTNAHRVLERV